MDSYTTYTERVLQPAPEVLGLKLLPFTLGHSMLLKCAKSQFILGDIESLKALPVKSMIVELVFAVLVCSTTYEDFKKEIHEGTLQTELQQYVNDLTAGVEKAKSFCLLLEVSKFINYIKSGTTAPLYRVLNDNKNNVKTNPVEPEEAVISTLMTECGYSRNECLTLPLTETLSAYILYAYKQGTIELISKEVFELEQKLGVKLS